MEVFIPHTLMIKAVQVPASKSYAQRAILAATLSKTPILIEGVGMSKDVANIANIAAQLGAAICIKNGNCEIHGGQNEVKTQLNCGESGLGVRLTGAIAAAVIGDFELSGSGSLLERPMTEFDYFLPQLGMMSLSKKGYLPIKISGQAKGGDVNIDGSLSSQYLSGLLMALPLLNDDSIITVKDLKSKPYVDITIDVLSNFGVEIEHESYKIFKVKGRQIYNRNEVYVVEGDYSAASIWMVLGALKNGIEIKGLNPNSVQADKMMFQAIIDSGAALNWESKDLIISPSKFVPFEFDANECPDLFPALVVLAAACKGITTLKGVNRLEHKESNRGKVLQKEFNKLGLKIELNGDEMLIYGTGTLESGAIHSNNDHRIAMAGAIASLLTDKGIKIVEAESVDKSYPGFWKDLGI